MVRTVKTYTMAALQLAQVITIIMLSLWAIAAHAGLQPTTARTLNVVIIILAIFSLVLGIYALLTGMGVL